MADVFGGDAGDFFYPLGSVGFRYFDPFFEAFGAVGYEGLVLQTFLQNHLGKAVEQGDVGAGVGAEPQVGVVAHVDAAGVDDDELGPSLNDGPAHAGGGYWVVGRWVAAYDQQATGVLVVGV